MNKEKYSRRSFVKASPIATAEFSVVPSNAFSSLGHISPSDKLNIAGVRVGGAGEE